MITPEKEAEFLAHLASKPFLRMSKKLARTSNEAWRQDLVQNVAMQAWGALDRFGGENMIAWLLHIMKNTAITMWRKYRLEFTDLDEETLVAIPVNPSQDERMRLNDVLAGIGKLTEDHRNALLMVQLDGVTYDAAAVKLKTTAGTVKSRVNRAKETLGIRLGEGGYAEVPQQRIHVSARRSFENPIKTPAGIYNNMNEALAAYKVSRDVGRHRIKVGLWAFAAQEVSISA